MAYIYQKSITSIYTKSRPFCSFWNLKVSTNSNVIFPRKSRHWKKRKLQQRERGTKHCLPINVLYRWVARSVHLVRARCGLATGQDELRESFWENFSKMQEVAATAMKHMRDLWPMSEPRSALSSLFRSSGRSRSWELMGVQRVRGTSEICPHHWVEGCFSVASSTARWAGDRVTGKHSLKIVDSNTRNFRSSLWSRVTESKCLQVR